MKILTISVLLLILTCSIQNSFACNKEKQLERLLNKDKYQACLKKSNKLIKKGKTVSLAYYYRSFVNFDFYKESTVLNKKAGYLKATTNNLSYAVKTDKDSIYSNKFSTRLNEIHDSLVSMNFILQKSAYPARANFFSNKLSEIFNDSTLIVIKPEFTEENILIIPSPPDTSSNEAMLRFCLLSRADSLIGIKYKYAGMNPETGFDCSGFVKYVYEGINYELPHKASQQAQVGKEIEINEAQPGDLVFFGYKTKDGKTRINHSGIIHSIETGIKEIIHCASNGVNIALQGTPNYEYWMPRIIAIRKIINSENEKEIK